MELSSSVVGDKVGDDDSVDSKRGRTGSVFQFENPFEHEWETCDGPQPLEIAPGQRDGQSFG
jgi:hypothetical protein